MKIRTRGAIAVLAVTLAFMGLLTGCSQQESGGGPSGVLTLNSAGSTLAYPIYSKWFSEYHNLHPNVQINYASIGSGGGIQQLRSGTVDFGASDMPLNDKLLGTFNFKIVQFATVLGAVVPIYNLPGVNTDLRFTPQALAGIYLGRIKKWNDPAITRANPGISFPDKDIVPVHRSDGSGTTFVWTDFLSKVSPEWKSKVGSDTSVSWPVGLGGKGSEGVTGVVEQTPYAFGYVELIYAIQNHLAYGLVQNPTGKFIKASLDNVTLAAQSVAEDLAKDIRVSITNAPGPDAYPISTFTYLLIPVQINNPAKRDTIKDFLHWMLTDGQKDAEQLSYSPLPQQVVDIELKQIQEIH
jgi:phosphate transport system substrate-binding protein